MLKIKPTFKRIITELKKLTVENMSSPALLLQINDINDSH